MTKQNRRELISSSLPSASLDTQGERIGVTCLGSCSGTTAIYSNLQQMEMRCLSQMKIPILTATSSRSINR